MIENRMAEGRYDRLPALIDAVKPPLEFRFPTLSGRSLRVTMSVGWDRKRGVPSGGTFRRRFAECAVMERPLVAKRSFVRFTESGSNPIDATTFVITHRPFRTPDLRFTNHSSMAACECS